MDKVLSLLENIGNYLLLIRISDILDIAIIAFLVYNLLRMVKSTRAENILKGVVAFLLVLWLVDILQLNAISYLMRNLVQVGIHYRSVPAGDPSDTGEGGQPEHQTAAGFQRSQAAVGAGGGYRSDGDGVQRDVAEQDRRADRL